MQKTAAIDYGFIKTNEGSCKWQFWSKKDDGSDIELEIQKDFNNITILKGNFKEWENPEHFKSVLDVLEIDWLYKALPHALLYIKPPILKYLLLKKITNPVLLAEALIGKLTYKVKPRMYFKHILQNPYFDSWQKMKRALTILLVSKNVEEALVCMPVLIETLKCNTYYSSLVYSAYRERFLIPTNLTALEGGLYIELLASKKCLWEADEKGVDSIDIFRYNYGYFSDWVSIKNFVKADLPRLHYKGDLQLPNGFELIRSEKRLIEWGAL